MVKKGPRCDGISMCSGICVTALEIWVKRCDVPLAGISRNLDRPTHEEGAGLWCGLSRVLRGYGLWHGRPPTTQFGGT